MPSSIIDQVVRWLHVLPIDLSVRSRVYLALAKLDARPLEPSRITLVPKSACGSRSDWGGVGQLGNLREIVFVGLHAQPVE